MAAGIELQPTTVKIGRPEVLFRLTGLSGGGTLQQSQDGKKFLTMEPEDGIKGLPMVVIQNWAARFK